MRTVENKLRATGLEFLGPSFEVQYVPHEEDLEKCFRFGKATAERVKEGSP